MQPSFLPAFSPALAGLLAVIGLEFFLGVAVVLQYLRTDQDWITAPLSFYLVGAHGTWLVAGYFALAAALLLVGLGFHLEVAPQARSRPALWLFGIAAAGVCTVAVAHTDLPGTAGLTPEGRLHNAAAIVAFVSAAVAMLLQAWWLRYDARWRAQQRKAFWLALIAFAALCLYALLPWLPRGAMQKSVILLIVLWLLMAGRWLALTRLRGVQA